jgi:hypothetical protein
MFSVTQALRDWMYDLVDIVSASHAHGRARIIIRDGSPDIQNFSIDETIERHISEEMTEIKKLFNSETTDQRCKFKEVNALQDTNANVTPIMAALDWEIGGVYENLIARGKEILKSAFKKAFPDTDNIISEPKNIRGCDCDNIPEFISYIKERLQELRQITKPDLGIQINPIPALQLITLRSLVGVKALKGTNTYSILQSLVQTPILFPGRLVGGDILCIYDDEGCTVVRFIMYYSAKGMEERILGPENFKLADTLLAKRERKNWFMPMYRAICYSLDQEDSPTSGERSRIFIHNFIDTYILSIKPRQG